MIRCFSPSSGLTHLVLLGPPDDVCGEFLSSLSDGGNCHLYDVWSSKTDSKGNFLPNELIVSLNGIVSVLLITSYLILVLMSRLL